MKFVVEMGLCSRCIRNIKLSKSKLRTIQKPEVNSLDPDYLWFTEKRLNDSTLKR